MPTRWDTPVDAHVVAELVRPIGSGARIGRGLDLREVSYVFPLAAHPGPAEWVAGRIFYRFFDQVLRWLLVLLAILVAAYAAYGALAVARGRSSGGPPALRSVLLEVSYDLVVLVFALVVVFLISRRTAGHAVAILASRFPGPAFGRRWEEVAIRELLQDDRPPPMAGVSSSLELAVFVSGHTHAPAMSELVRADGRTTVIANTGCWLRQLQPVDAWLGGPPVFVPAWVHSHVRVRPGQDGLTVELWEHPKPAERRCRGSSAPRSPAGCRRSRRPARRHGWWPGGWSPAERGSAPDRRLGGTRCAVGYGQDRSASSPGCRHGIATRP
jgi:hypothetical protein